MTRILIAPIILSCLLLSCSNREKLVDKSTLTGDDYRLFQNTPAWELAKAVQDENEKKIVELISNSPELINYQEPIFGSTLLFLTIENQQYNSFEILLKNKADVNIHDTYDGTSALIQACSFKRYDTKFAEALLRNGANVNDAETGVRRQGNSTRYTPLIAAAETGKLDLVKLLIKHGADVNFQNEYGQSALSEATILENYEVILFLLKNGADYKRPLFYRLDYSIPEEQVDPNDRGKPTYLVDELRLFMPDIGSTEYNYKMEIVAFLKRRGINYRATPIPEYAKQQARENYPNSWREYLREY